MVNINKGFLVEGIKERTWEELFKTVKKARSAKELKNILSKWLSADEKSLLEKRIAIGLLFEQGVRHNEIKRKLDASSATVSFVKRGLVKPPKRKKELGRLTARDFKKPKKEFHRFPAYTGKGRWSFLNNY